MFDKRRLATPAELERLYASWGIPDMNDQLASAEMSEVAMLADLAAMHTVLEIPNPRPGGERFFTVAESERIWAAGGGSAHDQQSYPHALALAAASSFAPELLFAPTTATGSGWWMIDGIHRAAALLTQRTAAGLTVLGLSVFVLPRPLR